MAYFGFLYFLHFNLEDSITLYPIYILKLISLKEFQVITKIR